MPETAGEPPRFKVWLLAVLAALTAFAGRVAPGVKVFNPSTTQLAGGLLFFVSLAFLIPLPWVGLSLGVVLVLGGALREAGRI